MARAKKSAPPRPRPARKAAADPKGKAATKKKRKTKTPPEQPPRPPGRPSAHSAEIADEICERLMLGESLRRICRSDHMPSMQTVCRWLRIPEHPFRDQYAHARKVQAEIMGDEIIDIADDGSNDWMTREGRHGLMTVLDHEHVQRSKLRVDSRKWLLSKVLPKVYGEKVVVTGEDGGPIKSETLVVSRDMAPDVATRVYRQKLNPNAAN